MPAPRGPGPLRVRPDDLAGGQLGVALLDGRLKVGLCLIHVDLAIEALKEHKVIGIFPEGTINRTKDIVMPFKIGAVKMAHDTNSSIVPFIITGKYKPFKNDLTIEFLKPYKIKSDDLTKENEKLMQIISKKLEEKRK